MVIVARWVLRSSEQTVSFATMNPKRYGTMLYVLEKLPRLDDVRRVIGVAPSVCVHFSIKDNFIVDLVRDEIDAFLRAEIGDASHLTVVQGPTGGVVWIVCEDHFRLRRHGRKQSIHI